MNLAGLQGCGVSVSDLVIGREYLVRDGVVCVDEYPVQTQMHRRSLHVVTQSPGITLPMSECISTYQTPTLAHHA